MEAIDQARLGLSKSRSNMEKEKRPDRGKRLDRWLEEVRRFAEGREDPYVWPDGPVDGSTSASARMFRVPSRLGNDRIYVPHFVPLGPFHFLESKLNKMEIKKAKLVADAVSRSRISTDFFRPLEDIRREARGSEDNFFTKMLRHRKHYYGDAAADTDEVFAFMMFTDAFFLLFFLMDCLRYENRYPLLVGVRDSNRLPIEGFRGGSRFQSSRLTNVLSSDQIVEVLFDIIRIENQIPLSALGELYPSFKDLDKDFKDFVIKINFEDFVINACEFFSPFLSASPHAVQTLKLHTKDHLLHCLYEMAVSLEPEDLPKKSEEMDDPDLESGNLESRTKLGGSAMELSKAGVKFKHYKGGIKHAFFDKSSCTLYLPRLEHSTFTVAVIHNMVAFEWGSSAHEAKIITSFIYLLNDLIQNDTTARDFQVLSRNEILVNLRTDDVQLVQVLKKLAGCLPRPSYAPIDDAKKEMNKVYAKRKGKILWSEFLEAYCSKPWVFISAIAATLLLGMTFVQVFCLFYRCNKIA